jgi:hypothetical protein
MGASRAKGYGHAHSSRARLDAERAAQTAEEREGIGGIQRIIVVGVRDVQALGADDAATKSRLSVVTMSSMLNTTRHSDAGRQLLAAALAIQSTVGHHEDVTRDARRSGVRVSLAEPER